MFFRTLLILAMAITVTACASKDKSDVSDIRVEERQEMTTGPLDGTEVYGEDSYSQQGPVPGTQQDLVVNIGDRVFYGYDQHSLTAEARRTLEMQAEWLKQYSNVNVVIAGHADERGTREYNLALGERRAKAAADYLINLGVSPSRVDTISYGKERPAVIGSNPSAWAQNRRAVTEVQ